MSIDSLKFPIGQFENPNYISADILAAWIADIASFPEKLRQEVQNLTAEQLDTVYRPGGWTIRQVIHHCADSHMNSFMRFKLALTEENPTIKPYFEDRWAMLIDSKESDISPSLKMLEGIHQRWTHLLKNLSREELQRTFFHPEQGKEIRIDENIGLYAWHGRHHLAHITTLKAKRGWK